MTFIFRWLGSKHRKLESGRRAGVSAIESIQGTFSSSWIPASVIIVIFVAGEQVGSEDEQDWRIQQLAHSCNDTGFKQQQHVNRITIVL